MSKVLCDHCGKPSDNLSAAGAGLYCEHCGEPSEKGEEAGVTKLIEEATQRFRTAEQTEHEAWGALMSELRKRGVGDVNEGGKDERLHDAITAWAEELVQLRLRDPNPENATKALHKRREKYLGND